MCEINIGEQAQDGKGEEDGTGKIVSLPVDVLNNLENELDPDYFTMKDKSPSVKDKSPIIRGKKSE